MAGFDEYLERMLMVVAATQKHKVSPADLEILHEQHFNGSPPSWLELAISEMEKRGWGTDGRKHGRSDFFISGGGLAEAQHLREKYRQKTWRDHMASISRSDWLALAAFIVSVIALFKD